MRARAFLPRPEYPRPDFQRSFVHGVDWINLNGPWQFRFDPNDTGRTSRWFDPSDEMWTEQIVVPFCWESLAAWGEADAAGNDHFHSLRVYRDPLEVHSGNYRSGRRHEVGWYCRYVTIPNNSHWRGRRVILTVGAADFYTDAWCNGVHLGSHEGGYIPFQFDITDELEDSGDGTLRGTIVFRVADPMDNRDQPVGKQWGWYSSVSGIWQTVYLEPRAAVCIDRFEVISDLEAGEVTIKVFTQGGETIRVDATAPDGSIISATATITSGEATLILRPSPMRLWEPNEPNLYKLKLHLRGNEPEDVVYSYFGIRSLSAAITEEGSPAALALNGQPIYIRGALYQSYYPDGIYTAGDVQMLKDDILYAKRVGFDLLRVHIKVDDPLLLYYADTIGILIMADFPNFGEGGDTPVGRRRYEEMMRDGIRRDFNHPSIIAWCLFNETWGFGGQSQIVKLLNPDRQDSSLSAEWEMVEGKLANRTSYVWITEMWHLAKSLDQSRLIEDMSVVAWEHLEHYGHGSTDINSWHFYTQSYEWAKEHIATIVRETYSGSRYNYVPGFEQGSQPLINSEYGGVGALDGDQDISWSFKFLTNELRLHGKISAYIFTELHDVEWERNGFLNYDRTPKTFGYDPTLVNSGDVLPIDAPPIASYPPGAEVRVKVLSSHFSRKKRENVVLYWSLTGMDSLGRMQDAIVSGSEPIPFTPHRVELAKEVNVRLPEQTTLCSLWVRAINPEGELIARNYVELFVDGGFQPHENCDQLTILRAAQDNWSEAQWSGGNCEGQEAAAKGYCYGIGTGFFRWIFPVAEKDLRNLARIRIICEASSYHEQIAQTDAELNPTVVQLSLNGVKIHESTLQRHPHDTQGSLSYLRGGHGEYGYPIHVTVEGELLESIGLAGGCSMIELECRVPEACRHPGGLVLYGYAAGRYPFGPTIILERAVG